MKTPFKRLYTTVGYVILGADEMTRTTAVSRVPFMCMLTMMIWSLAGCSRRLTSTDILRKYGEAVVLIESVVNQKEFGLGSGFLVSREGTIITNYHVIEDAEEVWIKTKKGDIYKNVSLITIDAEKDFAVLKIDGKNLPAVKLGNSDKIQIGERVYVVGNPRGYENTISEGLLSQLRDLGKGIIFHQIGAPISPGSSGSPVFNSNGKVIGIATLSDISGEDLNFSIPINYALDSINEPVKQSLAQWNEEVKEARRQEVANALDSIGIMARGTDVYAARLAVKELIRNSHNRIYALELIGRALGMNFLTEDQYLDAELKGNNVDDWSPERIQVYSRLIVIDPNNSSHYFSLAWIYSDNEDHEKALALFDKAIEYENDSSEKVLYLLRAARECVIITTDHANSHFQLNELKQRELSYLLRAVELWEAIHKLPSDVMSYDILVQIADIYALLKTYPKAIEYYELANEYFKKGMTVGYYLRDTNIPDRLDAKIRKMRSLEASKSPK